MNSTSMSVADPGAIRRRRFWRGLAVTALLSAVMVVAPQPSGAAVQTKSLNAACTGRTAEDKALLGAVGASVLQVPLTSSVDAPAFVEPEQTGVPVTVSWQIDLPADFADTAAGAGITQLTLQNANVDVAVSGPTDTTSIPGRPPSQTISISPGTPISSSFGPFSATLDNIGTGGLIKLRSEQFTFDVALSVAGTAATVGIDCSTAVTIASIPVKVAGSPDIVQPISVESTPGQPSTVDVLGQYVTNGFTKDGVEQQVDPSTLKIVEGDARIEGGKIVATGPEAGTSTDVTFEVCAGTIQVAEAEAGITDIQEMRIFFDPASQATRRQFGVRMALGTEQSPPIWSYRANPLLPPIFSMGFPPPTPPADEDRPADAPDNWQSWWQQFLADNNGYVFFTSFEYPSPAQVQAALEAIPGIGAGNVKVSGGEVVSNGGGNVPEGVTLKDALEYRPYTVEFSGDLAEQSVDQLSVARLYSFFPVEVRDSLLALAGSLGGDEEGGEGGGPTVPIPDGLTVQEYVEQLNYEAGVKLQNGDLIGYFATVDTLLTVITENLGALIDVGAVTTLLADIFQPPPEVVTVQEGADPVEAKFQELCSQGVVTLTSAGAAGETTENAGQDPAVGGANETQGNETQGGAAVSVAG